jgi:outer membrane protein TolC
VEPSQLVEPGIPPPVTGDFPELARAEIDTQLRTAAALAERALRTERELLVPVDVARQAARASFREGGGDVLRLVDAERVYIEAHRDGLDLKLDAIFATIRARLALGQEIAP